LPVRVSGICMMNRNSRLRAGLMVFTLSAGGALAVLTVGAHSGVDTTVPGNCVPNPPKGDNLTDDCKQYLCKQGFKQYCKEQPSTTTTVRATTTTTASSVPSTTAATTISATSVPSTVTSSSSTSVTTTSTSSTSIVEMPPVTSSRTSVTTSAPVIGLPATK
jgi:hypothetical protein